MNKYKVFSAHYWFHNILPSDTWIIKEPYNSNSMLLLCYISFAPLLSAFQNQRPSHSILGDEKIGQEELMTHSCMNTASFWSGCHINQNNILLTTGYETSYWHYASFSANRVLVLCKIFVQKSYFRIWKQHCWMNQLSSYGQDATNVEISVCD